MRITFRQGVVSHQETGFLEPNESGGVRIAASTRSTTITLAHRDTNYTHSEDNNVENAWPGPFAAGDNYYLYWEFDNLTFVRSFGYTTLEPISQSVPPGTGNSQIVGVIPGVASPISFGSFEVEGHYVLPIGKTIAVVGSTGSPNNDGVYTVQYTNYDLVTGNTTVTVNEAVQSTSISGELTLDIDSSGLPLFVNGRNWYDTKNNINYVLDNSNQWVQVLRVYAANLVNGTTFVGMSQTGTFTGSQIGDNTQVASGRVLFGDVGTPIHRDNNTFLTTEDQFFTNQSRVDAIRLESNVSRAKAFSSSLAQFEIVAWRADGLVASAVYDDTGNTVVGVLTESILTGEVGAIITQGTVTNSAWNWTSTLAVGSSLWISNGLLVGIDPNVSDPATYSIKRVPVARVLSVDTIIFEQGLGGVGPTGPAGSITNLPLASTAQAGIVYLSNSATNSLVPIAVSENHPVIIGGPYAPLSHSHTASQISFTPGNNIAATDAQNAITELAIEKLNLAGGIMTGILTLSGNPTSTLHAATKQYVDSLFQGLDAKQACLVGTTPTGGDIGGLYNSSGGTGGTGAITGALISKLDGVYGVDYTLEISSRILVKDQTDAKQNGIYVVTTITGSPPTTIDIERAEDFDSNSEIRAGNFTVIRSGATQTGQGWVLTDPHPADHIDLNVHDIIWTLVSSPSAYFGSSTINIDGSNIINVIDNTVNALNSVQWNTNTINITGSPSALDGQILTYNATSQSWENSNLISDICDLTVTCLVNSDTITSTKDLFALNINTKTGISISVNPPTPDSGYDFIGMQTIPVVQPKAPDDISVTYGHITNDGNKMLWNDNNGTNPKIVHVRDLAIPFDITSGINDYQVTYVGNTGNGGQGIFEFSNDGLKAFAIYINTGIEELQLTVPYDLSTATLNAVAPAFFSFGTEYSPPYFSEDGLQVYVGTSLFGGFGVEQYTLTTAWDISTLSPAAVGAIDVTADLAATASAAPDIHVAISNDGTKIFTLTRDGDFMDIYINQWDLSTPYDITTAVYNNVIGNIARPSLGAPRNWQLSPDGTNAYVFTDNDVLQYDISAGDSVTGATYSSLHYNGTRVLKTVETGTEVTGVLSFAPEGSPSTIPQVVFPNYTTVGLPSSTFEGGTVYDSDVNLLKIYNGTAWVAVGGVNVLSDLSDVTITTPAVTEILKYVGGVWINASLNIVEDLTPQLGANLDTNGFSFTTTTSTFTIPITNGTNGQVLQTDGSGNTSWQTQTQTKPLYEKINILGSPVSDIVNTTVSTIATSGSPLISSLQVFRNGILQEEDIPVGSPLLGDFSVTGANQITFATGILLSGDTIIIYVFN